MAYGRVRKYLKRAFCVVLIFLYWAAVPAQPLWAALVRTGPAPVAAAPRLGPVFLPISPARPSSNLGDMPLGGRLLLVPSPSFTPRMKAAAEFLPAVLPELGGGEAWISRSEPLSAPSPAAAEPLVMDGWERVIPAEHRFPGMERFADFYKGFVLDLDRQFDGTYRSDRAAFIRDVQQNRFFAKSDGLGELETKLVDGQVGVRFVPQDRDASPLVTLWFNVPLAVNAGLPRMQVNRPAADPRSLDVPLGDKFLEVYRSRLLIDRKIDFSRLRRFGTWAHPHRSVLIVDQANGRIVSSSLSPALKRVDWRWFKHWARATLQQFHYGDLVRGVVSASVQFGLGCLFTLVALSLAPIGAAFTWGPALVSGIFALVFAVFTDSYVTFVQRGENRSWESFKRLVISALLLAYPISLMQAHFDWGAILSLKTTVLVWLVGFGDRYLSTVMNVIPRLHQKYFMKPWFFPVVVDTPGRDLAAGLTGMPGIRGSTIMGVTLTREVLAIMRFAVKFMGLFLDPILMGLTCGLPVATLLLWASGLPFELLNYRSVVKLAHDNPRAEQDLAQMREHYHRMLPAWLRRLWGRWRQR